MVMGLESIGMYNTHFTGLLGNDFEMPEGL